MARLAQWFPSPIAEGAPQGARRLPLLLLLPPGLLPVTPLPPPAAVWAVGGAVASGPSKSENPSSSSELDASPSPSPPAAMPSSSSTGHSGPRPSAAAMPAAGAMKPPRVSRRSWRMPSSADRLAGPTVAMSPKYSSVRRVSPAGTRGVGTAHGWRQPAERRRLLRVGSDAHCCTTVICCCAQFVGAVPSTD